MTLSRLRYLTSKPYLPTGVLPCPRRNSPLSFAPLWSMPRSLTPSPPKVRSPPMLKKLRSMVARKGAGRNGSTNGTAATDPQGSATLTQSSHAERAAAWADHAHLSPEEQLREWERYMDSRLAGLPADPQAFLKRLLRQNGQLVDTVAVSAKAMYHVFMEEGRGDIEFFARRIVETNSPAQLEQNKELIEGLAKMYGDQSAERVMPLISELTNGQGHRTGQIAPRTASSVLGLDVETGMEVMISLKDRFQGLYGIGATGTGKTTLLTHMILSSIR